MAWQERAALATFVAAVLIAGCAQTTVLLKADAPKRPPGQLHIVLMPADIELSELTAGGSIEPKAEWTRQAVAHVTAALRGELDAKNARLIPYRAPTDDQAEQQAETQILKLHEAVGAAIIIHKLTPYRELPTKDKFDWALGDSVKRLRQRHDTEYALFVLFRDSYASAGRVMLMFGAALLGVGIPGGNQVGFASLVDLRSGDIVWFNRLMDPAGDLRTPEGAQRAVKSLLKELPL